MIRLVAILLFSIAGAVAALVSAVFFAGGVDSLGSVFMVLSAFYFYIAARGEVIR